MPKFPLIMTFSEVITFGDASLRVDGDTKVLAEFIEGMCVYSAVSAGGIEVSGTDLNQAYHSIRRAIRLVIEDCAHGTTSTNSFVSEINAVFSSVDPEADAEWTKALADLRAGGLNPENGVQNLPVKPAGDIRPVRVTALPALPADLATTDQILKAA